MKAETKTIAKVGIGIFLLYLAIHYWQRLAGLFSALLGAALPLVIGCVIAYLVNIVMTWYERRWFPRSKSAFVNKTRGVFCLILAIVSLLGVVSLVVWLVVPELVSAVRLIIEILPGAMSKFFAMLQEMEFLTGDVAEFVADIDWKSRIGQMVQLLTSGVGSVMDTVLKAVSSVFSGIVTGFLAVIFALYLLLGRDKLTAQAKRVTRHYLHERWYVRLKYILRTLNDCFHKFIVGQCTEAVILGLLCTLGMLIFGFPYATMIGALVAFTALIPVAGAYIGAGVGAFMILTVSPMKALLFLIFLVVLQQLEGNLIYPRVVGSSIGLPGIWVLAAVTVGGGIMGVTGMLLGVPLTAAVYRIVKDDMNGASPLRPAAPKNVKVDVDVNVDADDGNVDVDVDVDVDADGE